MHSALINSTSNLLSLEIWAIHYFYFLLPLAPLTWRKQQASLIFDLIFSLLRVFCVCVCVYTNAARPITRTIECQFSWTNWKCFLKIIHAQSLLWFEFNLCFQSFFLSNLSWFELSSLFSLQLSRWIRKSCLQNKVYFSLHFAKTDHVHQPGKHCEQWTWLLEWRVCSRVHKGSLSLSLVWIEWHRGITLFGWFNQTSQVTNM